MRITSIKKKSAAKIIEIEKEQKVSEINLKQLQNIFQNVPAATAIFEGHELKYILANQYYENITNRKAADLLGKSNREVFPELIGTGTFELFEKVLETGEPFTSLEYVVMLDLKNEGVLRQCYFNLSISPLINDSENIYGVIVMFFDITEQVETRKKIEESKKKFEAAILAVQGIIWTNNANGEMEGEQLGWANLTGQRFEEYQGFGWAKMIHPDDAQPTVDAWNKAVASKNIFEFQHRVNTRQDGWKVFSVKAVPVLDEMCKIKEWVGVHTDISEQRKTEEKLLEAKVSAENATKSKQQFLSNMSHEIRTPLNSIIGFTNVLLKTELGFKQKEFVQAINTSGKSLNLLINDILDLAKVDAGRMTFEKCPIEIRKSIIQILHSFDLKIKEKNLELVEEYDSKIPSVLLVDSLRLNQIILNLISNAVKFSHKGKIKISVKLLNETDENVIIEFSVTDSGIGIAANNLKSIFNSFEQAELSISTSYGGTGLGLAIVKQLVEAQGGSISVNSKLGEGSTFSFILPFGKTIQKPEEIEILKQDSEIKNLRVLVAEDVALNQLLMKIILNDFGFEHEIVGNGKIAIEKMQTNTYDIILMDLQMPEMNGFEATEYIRKTLKSHIPIIALTADVTTVDVSKCQEFGMDDYISKPINENLLYSRIVELVKNK